MFVVKRSGHRESVQFDKITTRIKKLMDNLDHSHVHADQVAQKTIAGVFDGVSTVDLDMLAANISAQMVSHHPDYGILAGRILISNHHKQTTESFSETMELLHGHVASETGLHAPLVSDEFMDVVKAHARDLDAAIDYSRDFDLGFFGVRTLEHSYLLKLNGRIAERPSHMWMRVAVGIHGFDIQSAIQTYELMSQGFFTHATPTLFNAGTPRPQMSSCFLMQMRGDSIEGIFETVKDCSAISKYAGGIGLAISNVRASGSYIAGTGGISNGLVPMIRVFDATAAYVDQGGGKRTGSFALYLELWHPDILAFLDLRKNNGKEEMRARNLFYGLWVCDIFMRRVESDSLWSLMCPRECPGLDELYGDEFDSMYTKYEAEGKARATTNARQLWFAIVTSQIETGTPYILFKDACNRKNNQQHVGVLKTSNLCTEILEFVAEDEIAVCNLASLALPKFCKQHAFDFEELRRVVRVVTGNLNQIIDKNFYPLQAARKSNLRHRPIGIGVQGLADVFCMMDIEFDSPHARELNRRIFESIYYAALDASCDLARVHGPYDSYDGSQISKGILQHDMWGVEGSLDEWPSLRAKISKWGVRNSLLVAPMPTASTAQILGNAECFEPFTSNVYTRRVLSGEFAVVNKHLVRKLIDLSVWNNSMRNAIIANDGSVQNIDGIPPHVKAVYKTVWEISQKTLIEMAADRGAFIDQSQSLNLFMAAPTFSKISSMLFYAWSRGLKTGIYYLRTQAACNAIPITVEKPPPPQAAACEIGCDSCGA